VKKYTTTFFGIVISFGIGLIFIVSCSNDSGQTVNLSSFGSGVGSGVTAEPQGSPLTLNERPRLLMNPRTLAAIAERTLDSHAQMYNRLTVRADELLTTPPQIGSYAVTIFDQSAILALAAAIEKHNGGGNFISYRDRAFLYAQFILDTVSPWSLTSNSSGISYNLRGTAGALSLIYDWLYADLPTDLKQGIHNFLRDTYKGLHGIDRPSGTGNAQIRKSVYGSNYWLEWGAHPWFSIALHGDGLGDEDLIEDALAATRSEIDTFMIPALNILGGALTNGWGYQLGNGDTSFAFLNLYAWQSATEEDVFTPDFALKDYPQYFLYASKPDGALIKIDDTADKYSDPAFPFGTLKFGVAEARTSLILLMDIYKDGYAKHIVDKNDFRFTGPHSDRGWRNLIFYDPAVQERLPNTLPLTRFFPGMGTLIGRSDWTADALHYTFRNRDQYGSHSDAKQNSFTIYSGRAPLAINDGNYPDGASSASSTKNYYRRTISSNSVLVVDPNETVFEFGASLLIDGGQKYGFFDPVLGTGGYPSGYAADKYTQDEFDQSPYNTASNEFEGTGSYTYIKGDATKGYTDKVTRFIREFVHIGDKYFVILDRVGSSNASFTKKWLLHSLTEPVLDGSESFTCAAVAGVESACQGNTLAGISKSVNTTEAVITNGTGRLFSKTLLPENSVVRKVGGDGYRFWQDAADQNLEPLFYNPTVTGGWRLEISPATPAVVANGESLDLFLNILEASTTDQGAPTNTRLLSFTAALEYRVLSNNMVGTVIENTAQNEVVLFASDQSGLNGGNNIAYNVNTTSVRSRHTLFNLTPNAQYLVRIAGASDRELATTAQGVLQFDDESNGNHLVEVFFLN
jgi:hypothetical protein